MAHYVAAVRSPLPPAQAFAKMADVERFSEWDPGVIQSTRIVGSGPGVGTAYDLTVKAGSTSVMRYAVTEIDAPRRVVLVARTLWLTSVDEIRVEAAPGGSKVVYDATLTLNGPLRLFDPVLGLAFRRIGDRAAAGLRRFLGHAESRA
jgi:hypothetical protein